MTVDIVAVDFDMTKFCFSPYTEHHQMSDSNAMTYDDSRAPKDNPGFVALFNEAVAHEKAGKTLHITLSGLIADPNLDFRVGDKLTSINAAEYLTGYNEYLGTLPDETLKLLSVDQEALDNLDKEWSVKYFRGKLNDLIGEQEDSLYATIYMGIDNAMGDIQRSVILISIDNPHKEIHGSFDEDTTAGPNSNPTYH